jgi:hypothetical protein
VTGLHFVVRRHLSGWRRCSLRRRRRAMEVIFTVEDPDTEMA